MTFARIVKSDVGSMLVEVEPFNYKNYIYIKLDKGWAVLRKNIMLVGWLVGFIAYQTL